jgi:predicted phage baseplate assembly protein
VSAIQAKSKLDTFTSTGEPDQVFRLTQTPVVEDTIAITIGVDTWVQVENFFNSDATSKHFAVVVDEFERATVIFGNGVSGQIPQTSETIVIDYKIGGGAGGNVAADTLTQLSGVLRDTANNTVAVTVTNVAAAGGGADRESVERARRRIPGAIRALTRTVSKEDFEVVALGVPGVARSLMLTSNEDSGIAENTGEIIVLPEGDPPSLPSVALKAQVVNEVTVVFPTLITFAVSAVDPVLLTIPVTADIKVKNGYTLAEVTTNIETDLAAFFATQDADGAPNPNVDFGANQTDALVAWSDIFKVVASATGVQRVEEDTFLPADDVAIDFREFPVLGTVTVAEI